MMKAMLPSRSAQLWKTVQRAQSSTGKFGRMLLQEPCEPTAPRMNKQPNWTNAQNAVKCLESGMRVFVQAASATPTHLIDAMTDYAHEAGLKDIETVHLHMEGDVKFGHPQYAESFRPNCLFIGSNMRQAVNEGRADFVPIFLSEIPLLFRKGLMPVDIALVQVSPPDKHGFCSLGTSVDITRAALQTARIVIGQVNQFMPRTHGDGLVHISHFDYIVHHDTPMHEHKRKPGTEAEKKIGELIASNLVQDGATLQMGIGSIPDAVLSALTSHKDLGIHTEMFSDGVLDLVERGVITNSRKRRHQGKLITSFCNGTTQLYDFVDDNPVVNFLDISYVNNPAIVAEQPRMTAINSCIEIDLTGQVVSDSIGNKMFSGVGGQVDFIRGAALCPDGRSIIAVPSRTNKGIPRIVPYLKPGAGVVTTRAHVHYVVTEHGIANLFGKTLRQRAQALIGIAHPEDRPALEKAAKERNLL